MRFAIISDIHANLEAFEACLADIARRQVDKLLFIGDIVGYGPDPDACVELLREQADICLAGNHDWAVLGRTDITYFNPLAKAAVLWTKGVIKPETKSQLEQWELTAVIDNMYLVHAAPDEPAAWHYIFTLGEARSNFNHFDTQLCFVGHSHVPAIVGQDTAGKCYTHQGNVVNLRSGYRWIINAGSVGQPRDGSPEACYAIYDDARQMVELIRVAYDVMRVQRKIIAAGLPHFLAHRLGMGR